MKTFADFNLPAPIQKNLERIKFTDPTPIQGKAIPIALEGRDVLGMAQTGTGKTGAFGIPMIVRLMANANPQTMGLVLAPTRELAQQIQVFLREVTLGSITFRPCLLIGGSSMQMQFRDLGHRPRIIVATPGRLMDHLRRNPRLLNQTSILVIDEADRMLDMGFLPQIETIKKHLPVDRQTLMFSATFPPKIKKLASEILRDPIEVSVGSTTQPISKIVQEVIQTSHAAKNDTLLDQLNARKGSVLIFTRTKSRTDRLSKYLNEYGFKVGLIHGDRSQGQRRSAIEAFRKGDTRILVATDVASRGLDIDDIAHVINYDLPMVAEDYVHRIGRTARNGKEGHALCLLTPEDKSHWRMISKFMGNAVGPEERGGGSNGADRRFGSKHRRGPKQQRDSLGGDKRTDKREHKPFYKKHQEARPKSAGQGGGHSHPGEARAVGGAGHPSASQRKGGHPAARPGSFRPGGKSQGLAGRTKPAGPGHSGGRSHGPSRNSSRP